MTRIVQRRESEVAGESIRSRYGGTIRVVQFNRHLYASAFLVAVALILATLVPDLPNPVRLLLVVVALLVVFQAALSLLASHWVYDLSPLKDLQWLAGSLPEYSSGGELRMITVHAGYDETSEALRRAFPQAAISIVDIYESLKRREPSIERARKLYPPESQPLCSTVDGWPIEASSVDLVLIAFAAHELRNGCDRLALFKQAQAVLKPGGLIVVVEHLRDLANGIAFGPGVFHFYTLSQWLRCARDAGLIVRRRFKITALVEVMFLCRS